MERLNAVVGFLMSEDGNFSIEALPWVLTIGVTMTLTYDTAMSYQTYNHVLRSVQDTNRLVSIGAIRDPAIAEQVARFHIASTLPEASAETVIDTTEGYVWTNVIIPWPALHPAGWLNLAPGDGMVVSAAHRLEWN